MKLPRVDKFLFYFELKTGAYVIAALSIITCIVFITILSAYMARITSNFSNLEPSDREFFRVFFISKLKF